MEIYKENNDITYLLNSFKFDNNNFKYEINETIFWFEGNQILTFLGYNDHNDIIEKYIKDKYIKTLNELKSNDALSIIDDNEKDTKYISEYGLNQLLTISKSDNTIVKLFQNKLFEEILPSIRKTGNYIYNANSNGLQPFNQITYFHDINNFTPYLNLNIVYIGETGEIVTINGENKMLYKFGKSSRSIDRDFKEYKKIFTDFKMISIINCDNNDIIEEYLKMELRAKDMLYEPPKKLRKKKNNINCEVKKMNILKPSVFNKTFVLTEKFDLNNVINLIKNLIDEYPLENIKKQNEKIKELEYNNKLKEKEMELKIKEEETKQKLLEFETKQMEKQEEMKQKQIELEKMKIEMEKLKIELEIKKLMSNNNNNLNDNENSNDNKNIDDNNYDLSIEEIDGNNSDDKISENNMEKQVFELDKNKIKEEELDKKISNSHNELKPLDSLFNDDMHFLMTDDIFKNDIFESDKLFENDTMKIKKWKEHIGNVIFNYSNVKDIKLCDKLDKLKEYTVINNKKILIGKELASKLIPFMKSK